MFQRRTRVERKEEEGHEVLLAEEDIDVVRLIRERARQLEESVYQQMLQFREASGKLACLITHPTSPA